MPQARSTRASPRTGRDLKETPIRKGKRVVLPLCCRSDPEKRLLAARGRRGWRSHARRVVGFAGGGGRAWEGAVSDVRQDTLVPLLRDVRDGDERHLRTFKTVM